MPSAAVTAAPSRGTADPLTGWQRLRMDRTAMISLGFLIFAAVSCFIIPLLMSDSRSASASVTFAPPGALITAADGSTYTAWLGTDVSGRDMLYRILAGGRVSLIVGLCAAAVSLFIGTLVGMTAGFFGGKVDAALMRLVDVLYANPRVLFVLVLISALNAPLRDLIDWLRAAAEAGGHDGMKRLVDSAIPYSRTIILILCLGFIEWLTMARIVRGQVLVLKEQQYISAARCLGQTRWKIMTRHLLPNLWTVILTYLTLTVPVVVLDESFLSFLGLGIEAPASSWGTLLKDGASAVNPLLSRGWLLLCPAAAMSATLLALNFLGDSLRDAFDVH